MSMDVQRVCELLELLREDVLKGLQYASIFITWIQERSKNKAMTDYWFTLYQKLFHSRRLFRVLSFIVYLPRVRELWAELREQLSVRGVFALLGNAFVGLFLLCDNVSVVMMMVGNPSYRNLRRLSYSIFLVGVLWQLIAIAILLRQSFREESELKKQLEEMTPVQFLQRLNEIDEQRKLIAIQFVNLVGDFVPALARTNMPEILVRTKVNKGTVGFFGMIASLTGIVLKLKKRSQAREKGLAHKFL